MSFGFSVSDIVLLGRQAHRLYTEIKEAPEICESFRKEVHLFSETLIRTALLLLDQASALEEKDAKTLKACIHSCKELIYIQILDIETPSSEVTSSYEWTYLTSKPRLEVSMFRAWRQKWAERKFAAKIPSHRRAISAHVHTLTALQAVINWYDPK